MIKIMNYQKKKFSLWNWHCITSDSIVR